MNCLRCIYYYPSDTDLFVLVGCEKVYDGVCFLNDVPTFEYYLCKKFVER